MIAVRVLRDGVVVREAVFRALPVTLGRGADCDVVLFDSSVSKTHARLEAGEAGAVLRDLGSRNGLRVGSARVDSAAVDGLLRCRLGLADVEIEALSDAPTREIAWGEWRGVERRRSVFDHLRHLALGTAGVVALEVADPSFWSPWNQNRTVQVLGSTVAALFLLPLMSFVLFAALKAAGRRLRMGDALDALAGAVWLPLAGFFVVYATYYVLPPSLHALLKPAVWCAVFVGFGVVAMSVRRQGAMLRFHLAWAIALVALWVGVAATQRVAASRSGQPESDYTLQPPIGGWTGPARELPAWEGRLRSAGAAAARAAEAVRERQAD